MNPGFNYCAPENFSSLFAALKQRPDTVLMAGGTDLLVNMRAGKIPPALIIDLKKIKPLHVIKNLKSGLQIGALATMSDLAGAADLNGSYSLLKHAASIMGCAEIRNRATIGGNIVNASPGGETILPLTVLDAVIVIRSSEGRRRVPITKFISRVNSTCLMEGEILENIIIPKLPVTARGYYIRRARVKGMDLASVNFALLAVNPSSSRNRDIRISLGTVSTTPYRAYGAEKILSSGEITKEKIRDASESIISEIAPRASSLRATPEYKKLLIEPFLYESLKQVTGKKL